MSCGLSPLLLDFVHLVQVVFGAWVHFLAKALFSLKGPSLRLADLVDFEAAPHSGMHHDFTRRRDLLEAIEGDIVEVAGRVEIPFLISHNLLKKVVSPRFPLLSLE